MREMKDSGVPWIGMIPEEWFVVPLKGLGRFYGGLSGKAGDDFVVGEDDYYELFVPFTNIFNNNIIQLDKLYKVRIVDGEKQTLVHKGDILFLMSSEDYDGLGKPALMNEEVKNLHLNSFCKGFRPDNRVVSSFLNYYLQGQTVRDYVRSNGNGFIRINLKVSKLGMTSVLLPPFQEQQRIADFLDTKCAEIDSILEKTRASIEEYKKLKQSVITEAVTKGIRGDRPMKDSGVEWIGEMPEEWAAKAIKYCFRVVSGGTPNTNIPEFWDGDIPWITPADYKTEDHYISLGKRNLTIKGLESCNSIMAPKGSVVFSKRAPIGTVAISANELCTNQGCLVCIPKKVYSEYFYYAFTAFKDFFELYGSGTTFKEISITSFVNFRVPVPSFEEQQEIAAYLDEKCAAIDSLIASKEALISELESYKKSLIYEYVTGKKEVI